MVVVSFPEEYKLSFYTICLLVVGIASMAAYGALHAQPSSNYVGAKAQLVSLGSFFVLLPLGVVCLGFAARNIWPEEVFVRVMFIGIVFCAAMLIGHKFASLYWRQKREKQEKEWRLNDPWNKPS